MHLISFTIATLLAQVAGDSATVETIETAIRQLGSEEFSVRQQATDLLWSVGEPAVAALQDAARSPDPEVRLRARSILERYSYGIFAETPADEVRLINQFRYGNHSEKRKAYQRLAKQGGVETLLTLLKQISDRDLRMEFRELVLTRLEQDRSVDRLLALATAWRDDADEPDHQRRIEASMRRQVPWLLVSSRSEQAESILKQAATTDEGMRDWSVYLLLMGKLDQTLVKSVDAAALDADQLKQQTYLWRIQGNLDEATRFAERLGEPAGYLLRGILFERRDWPALAKSLQALIAKDEYGAAQNIEARGYAAAFCRLAGDKAGFDSNVESIRSLARVHSGREWNCAEALLINQQIDAGLEVLRPRWSPIAFEMLCFQERYRDAFRSAGLPDPHGDSTPWFEVVAARLGAKTQSTRRFELAIQVARALYQLGEQEQGLRGFEILSKAVQHERGSARLLDICKAEYRAGLWEQACRHAAIILDKGKYPDPLPTLFPRHGEQARVWFDYFQHAQELPKFQALLRTGRALRGEWTEGSDQQLVELAAAAAKYAERLEPVERNRCLLAIAETCKTSGRVDLVIDYLTIAAASSSEAALRLGDIAAREEDWVTAARWYEKARSLDPESCLARYCYGYSLKQNGRPDAGQAEIDLALLLPLANSTTRRQLAAGLKERGLRAEAVEQWRLILRSGESLVSLKNNFKDTALVDAAQNVGNSLAGDTLGRAAYWEIMHLSCLEAPLWIPTYRGYFHTPHILHKTRAQAYLSDGQIELARREIKLSRAFMPGNIELAEHLVPQLEQAGQQADADQLFDDYFQFVRNICAEFPDSPLHHNNLAWLCARCNRQLDVALTHVQRALELSPRNASYLDTLGEVHFRRGEYEEAIECARQCLQLEPHNEFFQQQLDRFQHAQNAS